MTPRHGDTGITGVVTRRLTGGKISSPSQPEFESVSVIMYLCAWGGAHWLRDDKLCFLPMSPCILLEVRETVLQNASKQPWLSFLEQRETLH